MGSSAPRAVLTLGNAALVALGFFPLACAVGGEVTDETMLAAALREEAQGAANLGGMGPVDDNHLALPTRDPNAVNPEPAPMPSEGEPEPVAPGPQPNPPALTPTPPSSAPANGGSGGEAPRPVFTPPVTPTGGTSAGGAASEPEPMAEPAAEPVPEPVPEPVVEPEPAPFPQFPFPQPEPAPEPATEPTTPAPDPTVPRAGTRSRSGQLSNAREGGQLGELGVEEVCFTVMGPIAGWQASGLENGMRTITVNGMQVTSGAALPDSPTYTFAFSAGEPPWVAWNYW